MEFNKKATLRNLKSLETTISGWYDLYNSMSCNNDFQAQCYEDLMFVRGLMDDIQCGRITEMEVN